MQAKVLSLFIIVELFVLYTQTILSSMGDLCEMYRFLS